MKVKLKRLEIENEKWKWKQILENSRETRISLVSGLHLVFKKSNGCNLWRLTSSNPGRFRAGLYQSRKWENQQRINYSLARVINGAFQEWRMKIKLLGLHSSQSTEQLAGSIGGRWHMPGPITGWSNRPLWLPSCACSLLSQAPNTSPPSHT